MRIETAIRSETWFQGCFVVQSHFEGMCVNLKEKYLVYYLQGGA